MRLVAALAVVVPTAAAALGEQSRDALLTALATNDCAVTENETARVFGAQGFDGEFVRRELGQMVLDETAFLEGGYVLRVKADHCPPADPLPTPAQAFRNAIVERGCSIDEDDASELGVESDRVRPVLLSWIESGAAAIEGDTLVLEDCK